MSSVATTRPELVPARHAPPRLTMRARFGEALPKIVLAPSFISTCIFVYGFILWTIYLSFTNSKAFPSSVLTGTRAYERLWRWTWESDPPSSGYTSIPNLGIFGVL
jgi:glucose/mannose transport system permease protein